MLFGVSNNNNNNRRLVTLAEHTSDHPFRSEWPSLLVLLLYWSANLYMYIYAYIWYNIYAYTVLIILIIHVLCFRVSNNSNNNIRLVTLAEHTSDHGKQTNSITKEKGEHG